MVEIECIDLSSGDDCSTGWVNHDGICYQFNSGYNNKFAEARSKCSQEEATLVSIPSKKVNDFLKE